MKSPGIRDSPECCGRCWRGIRLGVRSQECSLEEVRPELRPKDEYKLMILVKAVFPRLSSGPRANSQIMFAKCVNKEKTLQAEIKIYRGLSVLRGHFTFGQMVVTLYG